MKITVARCIALVIASITCIGCGANVSEEIRVKQIGDCHGINTLNGADGETFRISDAGPADISEDGMAIVFQTKKSLSDKDTNKVSDIYLLDRRCNEVVLVSARNNSQVAGNRLSCQPRISGNGRYVSFVSSATDLVDGDTNDYDDIFVRDLDQNRTVRVNISEEGVQDNADNWKVWAYPGWGPQISWDGRFIAFFSASNQLVPNDTNNVGDIFVRDMLAHTVVRVSVSSTGGEGEYWSTGPSLSSDGRYIAFWSSSGNLVSNDSNDEGDIFVHDTLDGTTKRIETSLQGIEGSPTDRTGVISGNGRWLFFGLEREGKVVQDLSMNSTYHLVESVGDDYRAGLLDFTVPVSVSNDGSRVAFESNKDVNNGDGAYSNVFVYLRDEDIVIPLSVSPSGELGNGASGNAQISGNGRWVVFSSSASNLVEDDLNTESDDVFIVPVERRPVTP